MAVGYLSTLSSHVYMALFKGCLFRCVYKYIDMGVYEPSLFRRVFSHKFICISSPGDLHGIFQLFLSKVSRLMISERQFHTE